MSLSTQAFREAIGPAPTHDVSSDALHIDSSSTVPSKIAFSTIATPPEGLIPVTHSPNEIPEAGEQTKQETGNMITINSRVTLEQVTSLVGDLCRPSRELHLEEGILTHIMIMRLASLGEATVRDLSRFLLTVIRLANPCPPSIFLYKSGYDNLDIVSEPIRFPPWEGGIPRSKTPILKNIQPFPLPLPPKGTARQYLSSSFVLWHNQQTEPPTPHKLFLRIVRSVDIVLERPRMAMAGTFLTLTEKIMSWVADREKETNILYLHGASGSGKSVLAQTIQDRLKTIGTSFVAITSISTSLTSRTWSGSEQTPFLQFLSTVAYGLASSHKGYRKGLVRALAKHKFLSTSEPSTQYTQLLVSPFSKLKMRQKFLIIVDGLNTCEEGHGIILKFINKAARNPKVPIIWMICTRNNLKTFPEFCSSNTESAFLEKHIPSNHCEAIQDIELFLQYELRNFRPSTLPSDEIWPPPESLQVISQAADGNFSYATCAADYIKDARYVPEERLQVLVDFIKNPSSAHQNPFLPLHSQYKRLLANVRHHASFPLALWIIRVQMINEPVIPSVLDLANLFELSSGAFYQALSPLSPFIITIPHGKLAAKKSLHLNSSFLDMMASPEQIPWLTEASTRQFPERLTRAYIYALSETNIALSQCLTWKSETGDSETNLRVAHHLARLAAAHTWKTCTQITLFGQVLHDRIHAFDFRRLQRFASSIPVNDFWRFLRWLVKAIEDNQILASIIRSKPESDLDFKLVEQCRKIAKPLDLNFQEPRTKALRDSPCYVLLGLRREETIVVILIPDAVTIYSVDDPKYLDEPGTACALP